MRNTTTPAHTGSVTEIIEDIYPLSPQQQGILFHTLHVGDSAVYLCQTTARLHGLDAAAFQRDWAQVVRRHPVLRSAFQWEGVAEPVQVVYRSIPPSFHVADWRHLPTRQQENRIHAFVTRDRDTLFSLSSPPLARYALLRLSDEDYQFLWTHHALLLDGWSSALVMHDLTRQGAASRAGTAADSPNRVPYSHFVDWIRRRDHHAALDHWQKVLRGFTEPTPLPLAVTGPDVNAGNRAGMAEHTAALSVMDSERLGAVARACRVPQSAFIQAAWALVLMRFAEVDDVVFGQVVSGRSADLPGVQDVVGLLTNTVPVRARVRPDERVASWLRTLHAGTAAALEYEHSPLIQIHRCSELPRVQPLFQTILVLQNYPLPDGNACHNPGYQVSATHGFETTHYPITLFVVPGERLQVRIVHDLAVVSAANAQQLARCVVTALIGLADCPDRPVSRVPVFDAATLELAHLGDQANVTDHQFAAPHTVGELFAARAAANPDAPAVVGSRSLLTYRELDRRTNQLGHVLIELGARPEERVAVVLNRSEGFVTAALAVLKAGAAYVPIDPAYPPARTARLVQDSACRIVVTRHDLLDRLPATCRAAAQIVFLDPVGEVPDGARVLDRRVIDRSPDNPLRPRARPGNLAYVIYTSGSTGAPKGVMVTHRAVLNTLRWMAEEFRFGAGDVIAFKTPVSFTDSVCEVLWPLCSGAALTVLGSATVRDPSALYEALRERDVTYCQFVPRQLDLFMAGVDEHIAGDPLPRLRRVLNGGEPLPARFVATWDRRFTSGRIANTYGMTESAIYATHQPLPRGLAERLDTVPLGFPIANTRVYVLNRELEQCPVGVAGELYVGGVGLARGYLGQPGLTAERFVPDMGGGGGRLYRTGDRVRRLPGGALDFVGRMDFQVKVRGFRVELGEVEATLSGHPAVRDVVVVARDDETRSRRLVAYVVAQDSGSVPVTGLREFASARLPDHMVPAVFVRLDVLPLTRNGKVDRKALPAPEGVRPELEQAFVAPRDEAERVLAETFADVLGVDRVGVHDDFFTLGGDSLMAVRLVGQVRETFLADYTLAEFFTTPTVAGAATSVERLLAGAGDVTTGAPGPRPVPRDGTPLPASFSQERLWLLDQIESGSPAYVIAMAVRIRGELDVDRLQAALADVTSRHEVLRTCLQASGSQLVQEVHASIPVPWQLTDVSTATHPLEICRSLLAEDASVGFDLAVAPLWRVRLVRVAPRDHVLGITLHHAISDAWSMGVLLSDVGRLYTASAARRPTLLPVQYGDFAVWQRHRLTKARLAELAAFWRQELAGAPELLALPTDRPRPRVRSHRGARFHTELAREMPYAAQELCGREGATPFMTLLAGFVAVLSRWSGQHDMVIGTPVAGRDHPDLEPLIGFFVNSVMLRTDVSGRPSFRQLLRRVRQVCLRAFAHQDLPFDKLVEQLAPTRSTAYTPVFQVNFGFGNAPRGYLDLPGTVVEPVPAPDTGGAKFDLSLYLQEADGRLHATFEYATDLFDAVTIERLAGYLNHALATLLADPDRSVADLPEIRPAGDGPSGECPTVHAQPRTQNHFRAPRDRWERYVAQTWAEVLDTARIGSLDDFFDLGGNSMAGMLVADRLRRLTGQPVTLVDLFAHRTVESMASALRSRDMATAEAPFVVELRPSGPGQPLFFLPAVTGELYHYFELAKAWGSGRPLYGIQPDGFFRGGADPGVLTMSQLAARYADEVHRAHPEGPYHLCGFSAAGRFAVAVADRLHADGHRMGSVVLLDTAPLGDAPPSPDRAFILARWLLFAPPEQQLRALDPGTQLIRTLEAGKRAGDLPPDCGLSEFERFYRRLELNALAVSPYRPSYPGTLTLLTQKERTDRDLAAEWACFPIGELRLESVDVDSHLGFIRGPAVPEVARRLEACLDEAAPDEAAPNGGKS